VQKCLAEHAAAVNGYGNQHDIMFEQMEDPQFFEGILFLAHRHSRQLSNLQLEQS